MSVLRTVFPLASLILLALAGCKDTHITTYRIPKEAPARPVMAAAPNSDNVHWQAPAGWQERPGNGMRRASFQIAGADGAQADMAVTVFPGDVGGDLANVNRWRGQIKLPPIADSDLSSALQKFSAPAGDFLIAELVSDEAVLDGGHKARILGAMFKQPDRIWFFKLAGEDQLVAAQRDNFTAFLSSVQFTAPATAAAPPFASSKPTNTNDLPRSNADMLITPPVSGPDLAPSAAAPGGDLTWQQPADWQPKPGSAMRKGSFSVPGSDGSAADMSIIAFPGEAGGDLANVNRWRGQVGLAPVTDLPGATTGLDSNGIHFTVVDFAGTTASGPTRLLGALAASGGQTWFFKLMGPDATVAAAKPAFLDFLKTVKAP